MIQLQLPVSIIKEGKHYIAYTPALDLSTSGKTYAQVKRRFNEVVEIFFEEISKAGTVDEVLGNLGWRKVQTHWTPPTVVSHEPMQVKVPVYA